MKEGDLVVIFPMEPDIGMLLGPDETCEEYSAEDRVGDIHPLNRSKVLFDGEIYSVPTFQLEAIEEMGDRGKNATDK